MRLLFGTVFALVIAAAIGLGGTWIALTRGSAYGGVTIGAWTGWPKNGTAGIDPYARAMVARTGELPVGSGDGVAFYASTDDAGQPLDGRCDVLFTRSGKRTDQLVGVGGIAIFDHAVVGFNPFAVDVVLMNCGGKRSGHRSSVGL